MVPVVLPWLVLGVLGAVSVGVDDTAANSRQGQLSTDESQVIKVTDCSGTTYELPLNGSDASVLNQLLSSTALTNDPSGMAGVILQMVNSKSMQLKSIYAQEGSTSALGQFLSSLLPVSSTACSSVQKAETVVSSQSVATEFGANAPVFESSERKLDDQPTSGLRSAVTSKGKAQPQRYARRKERMFHTDQANVKIEDILPTKSGKLELYQGDMIYPPQVNLAQTAATAASTTGSSSDTTYWSPWRLWPNAQVNWYAGSAAVDTCAVATFKTAISMWEKYTCVRFTENVTPDSATNSIELTSDGKTCFAYVGMSSSSQVNLGGAGCQIPGIALHEIGHGLGLIHQQSRKDRDSFVTIEWNEIQSGAENNFLKIISGSSYDSVSLKLPYDYSSIMHYSAWEFSIADNAETISPSDTTATGVMGQRQYLSQTDIQTINQMYGCTATCGDGIQNQGETGVDCGGPCRQVCGDSSDDGIIDVPAECSQSGSTGLSTKEWIILAGIAGGIVLLVLVVWYVYSKRKAARKDEAKRKLMQRANMPPEDLRALLQRRVAAKSAASTAPKP